jgi:hypothetical protein
MGLVEVDVGSIGVYAGADNRYSVSGLIGLDFGVSEGWMHGRNGNGMED